MIALVRIALSRPYTFVVLALLLLIIGPLAALRTPTDIFPGHPHPRDRRGLELYRPAAGPDVGAYHHAVPAGADDDRQRHRAHRRQFLYRHRDRQDLLPAERRHPHRQRPGHGDLADDDQAVAARRDPAADPQLQRLHRSDHPGCAVGRRADRAEPRRYRHQPVAHAAGHRAGRGHSLSVRRQAAPGPDRPQSRRAAGPRPVRPGRRQRARRAEPDHAGRHPEDRPVRIHHPAQQLAASNGRARRPADQGGERRDGLCPRRRLRARRQPAADQHRARRRQPLGADDGAEGGRDLDARYHRRHQAEGDRGQGFAARRR